MIDKLFELPQIPFEVTDHYYGKTISIVSSCDDKRKDGFTLYFSSLDPSIQAAVKKAINKVFDMPGVTRVQVCRR